jgi:RES domain-containing protein
VSAQIATVPVTGTWYRHVPAGAPPMPGHRAGDGRWQRGEQLAGLYLAQDTDTVWAEWYRALAELGERPDEWLPRDLWRFSLRLEHVADLSQRRSLRALGLPEPRPDRDQWPAFQAAGLKLAHDGADGILFRSSARPAGLCVCVFGTEHDFAGVTPMGKAERIDAAPAPPRGMRT